MTETESARQSQLRQKIERGIDDIRVGRVANGPDSIEKLKRRILDDRADLMAPD